MRMAENNVKQADYIAGAELLKNSRGSAPGQWLDTTYEGQRRVVILLPGPPFELEGMFNDHCFDRLKPVLPEEHLATCELKIAMVPESTADQRAANIYKQFPDVETTILAHAGEVQFHLKARGATQAGGRGARSRSWLRCLRMNSPTRFFPLAVSRWNRLSATFSRCAARRCRSPRAAPAVCWPSASPASAAPRDISWAEHWCTPTS